MLEFLLQVTNVLLERFVSCHQIAYGIASIKDSGVIFTAHLASNKIKRRTCEIPAEVHSNLSCLSFLSFWFLTEEYLW